MAIFKQQIHLVIILHDSARPKPDFFNIHNKNLRLKQLNTYNKSQIKSRRNLFAVGVLRWYPDFGLAAEYYC